MPHVSLGGRALWTRWLTKVGLTQGVFSNLSKWLFFSFFVSALPIGLLALRLAYRGDPVSFTTVLGGGDLFLVTVAVGAPAIGDLIGGKRTGFAYAVGGTILIATLLAAWSYSEASADPGAHTNVVAVTSLVVFGLVGAAGSATVWLGRAA